MIDNSEWKEFRIGDIFDVFTGSLLDIKTLKNGKIPRISVTNENNGILDYFDSENSNNARHFENFISVNFFGQCFYHPYKASLEMKVHVLKLKNREFNKNLGLFFSSILNKTLENKFTYSKQLSSSKLKNDDIKIILPTKNNKIDFDFMENFIDKIEQKQRGILEFYKHKKQNGGGYELNSKTWKEFKIGDLFDIHPTKNYGLTNNDLFKTNGKIPVIVNSSFNNGVGNYVNLEPTEKGNIVTFSDTTTSESIFYQPRDFIGYSHVQGVYPFSSKWEEKTLLYFVAVFRKATLNRFDYANKFNRKIAKETNIKLPITASGEIDFDFMESFIKAISEECIKGVDSYLAISTTKELIK
jgi:hypothetical protein